MPNKTTYHRQALKLRERGYKYTEIYVIIQVEIGCFYPTYDQFIRANWHFRKKRGLKVVLF